MEEASRLERARGSWVLSQTSWILSRTRPLITRPHNPFKKQPHAAAQTRAGRNSEAGKGGKKCENRTLHNGGLPQLFGVVLFNLCPLLHKLHILLHQFQARLCMLLNDVILVLERAARQTNKDKNIKEEEMEQAFCSDEGKVKVVLNVVRPTQ